MGTQVLRVDATCREAPDVLFDLLAKSANWPVWSPIGEATIRRTGADDEDGVGAIREFRTGRTIVVEEITEFERPGRISYTLLDGLPVRTYHANISLTPAGEGTAISWQTSFEAKIPGTGWIYRLGLRRMTRRIVQAAIEAVEA